MASSLTYSLEGRQAGLSAGHDFQQPARFRSWFPASSHHRSRDALNRSKLGTVVCVPLTSNLKWAEAPGNL